jgi:uncharacterized membrane protein YbhN (UPF0104 family)
VSRPPGGRPSFRLPPIRFFSSARDAARARRPSDLVLLIAAGAGLLAVWGLRGGTPLTRALIAFIDALPGLFGWFWELSYDLAALWALLLVLVGIVARRLALTRDQVLAVLIALALAALMAEGSVWVRGLVSSDPPAVFPPSRLALVTAVLLLTSPHLALPFRRIGRWLLILGVGAGIALGAARPIGVLAALAIGAIGAMASRLAFGTPGGLPTLEQVAAALADLGIDAHDLRPAELESRGVVLVRASSPDGRPLLAKVYGRDARDGQLLATIWGNLWYRDDTSRLALGRRQQVEHEAFLTLLAERGGVPVAPIVSAGVTSAGDALVVLEAVGSPLSRIAPDEIHDESLRGLWEAVDRLHDTGIAHGRLDGTRLLVLDGASVRIADLAAADRTSTPSLLRADEAQLLVTTALAVGDDRAIRAARDAIGDERLGEVLPYLQTPVLEAETRRAIKSSGFEIEELRAAAARAVGVDEPKLERVRRVTWGSLATAALLALGGYFLVSGIAGLGLEEILGELETASSGWIVAGLVLGPLVQVAQALSTLGASPKAVRFGPVVLLQFAVQFLALAVPSSASRIALNVRFFRGVGLTATEAIAVGAVDSFAGFLVEALIVVVVLVSGAASLELELDVSIDISPKLIALIGLVLVLLVLAAIAVPKVRSLVRAKTSEATSVLRGLRSPTKVALLIGGNVAARLLLAAILSTSLLAFGIRLPLAELLLVNTLVSLFAGIMPIPGGIGVAEAATTAGLVAFGVPDATAVAAAIVFRLVTFYLPPIWGVAATRRLRQQGFI